MSKPIEKTTTVAKSKSKGKYTNPGEKPHKKRNRKTSQNNQNGGTLTLVRRL